MTSPVHFPLAIDSTTLPCKVWDKAANTDGYGLGWFEGKLWRVHRYAMYKKQGFLTPCLDVCHSCNVKLCWEPSHLWEGTRAQNMAQATNDGLTSKKLTPDQVREIRKLLGECNWVRRFTIYDSMIAKEFGVSRYAITDIRTGRAWSNLV
jgi:hypothetical protein